MKFQKKLSLLLMGLITAGAVITSDVDAFAEATSDIIIETTDTNIFTTEDGNVYMLSENKELEGNPNTRISSTWFTDDSTVFTKMLNNNKKFYWALDPNRLPRTSLLGQTSIFPKETLYSDFIWDNTTAYTTTKTINNYSSSPLTVTFLLDGSPAFNSFTIAGNSSRDITSSYITVVREERLKFYNPNSSNLLIDYEVYDE